MSNTKHTEGPWYVTTGVHSETTEMYDKGETWFNVNGPDGVIADVLHGRCLSADEEEAEANAQLIASAPSLLEALKECEEYFDDKADVAEGFYPTPNKEMQLLTTIRNAIKQAENNETTIP